MRTLATLTYLWKWCKLVWSHQRWTAKTEVLLTTINPSKPKESVPIALGSHCSSQQANVENGCLWAVHLREEGGWYTCAVLSATGEWEGVQSQKSVTTDIKEREREIKFPSGALVNSRVWLRMPYHAETSLVCLVRENAPPFVFTADHSYSSVCFTPKHKLNEILNWDFEAILPSCLFANSFASRGAPLLKEGEEIHNFF